MFGLSTFKLIAIGLAAAALVGGVLAWRSSLITMGEERERAKWELAVEEQKKKAANLLASEAAKVIDTERRLAAATEAVEATREKANADLAHRDARYNRLGKLYEQQKSRCGGSGSGPANGTAAGPGVADGGTGTVGGGSDVPRPDGDDLGRLARDADQLRLDFLACADSAIELRRAWSAP